MPRKRRYQRRRRDRQPGDAMTIQEFCDRNRISRSLYFTLKRKGKGPREMHLLNKAILISPEAEAEWRREREHE